MTKLAILIGVCIGVAITTPLGSDVPAFYYAGLAIRHVTNPYPNSGYFNPLHVGLGFAPLSVLSVEIVGKLIAGLAFGAYVIALYRLVPRRVFWIALCSPLGLQIARYGNLDAFVLLGASMLSPVGVWMVIAKPQTGVFAALIMLRKLKSWRLTVAVGVVLAVSLSLGMIHGGLNTSASISLFPYGIVIGLPLLWRAWRTQSVTLAMAASCFLSPYVTPLNWSAAMPMFGRNRLTMTIGVVLSWVLFLVWRSRL